MRNVSEDDDIEALGPAVTALLPEGTAFVLITVTEHESGKPRVHVMSNLCELEAAKVTLSYLQAAAAAHVRR